MNLENVYNRWGKDPKNLSSRL